MPAAVTPRVSPVYVADPLCPTSQITALHRLLEQSSVAMTIQREKLTSLERRLEQLAMEDTDRTDAVRCELLAAKEEVLADTADRLDQVEDHIRSLARATAEDAKGLWSGIEENVQGLDAQRTDFRRLSDTVTALQEMLAQHLGQFQSDLAALAQRAEAESVEVRRLIAAQEARVAPLLEDSNQRRAQEVARAREQGERLGQQLQAEAAEVLVIDPRQPATAVDRAKQWVVRRRHGSDEWWSHMRTEERALRLKAIEQLRNMIRLGVVTVDPGARILCFRGSAPMPAVCRWSFKIHPAVGTLTEMTLRDIPPRASEVEALGVQEFSFSHPPGENTAVYSFCLRYDDIPAVMDRLKATAVNLSIESQWVGVTKLEELLKKHGLVVWDPDQADY